MGKHTFERKRSNSYAEMTFICADGTRLTVNTNMTAQEAYAIRAKYWASFSGVESDHAVSSRKSLERDLDMPAQKTRKRVLRRRERAGNIR